MKFVLKGKTLLEKSGLDNTHQLAMKAQVSFPTILKYIRTPDEMKWLDLEVFANLLHRGMELTPEQVLDLRLGDLFDLKE